MNQTTNGMLTPRIQHHATVTPCLLFLPVYYSRVDQGPLIIAQMNRPENYATSLLKAQLAFLILSLVIPPATAEERSYGRSMVVTPYGIVATSYVQASQAGARILEQGGSAIDAGIAARLDSISA